MIDAVASGIPAFLVMAARSRAEQHATRFETGAQLQQHARQFLAGDMKQRGVGEHAIEMAVRQIEREEILLPYVAAAMGARHRGEMRGAFQTDRGVTELGKRFEVAAGPAAKVQYRKRRGTLDALQQRSDVLLDVVVARALPERFGAPVVVVQRATGDAFQVLRTELHIRSRSRTRQRASVSSGAVLRDSRGSTQAGRTPTCAPSSADLGQTRDRCLVRSGRRSPRCSRPRHESSAGRRHERGAEPSNIAAARSPGLSARKGRRPMGSPTRAR